MLPRLLRASKAASVDKARADRRAKVRELADKGWANTRIAKEIGSTPTTVKADVECLPPTKLHPSRRSSRPVMNSPVDCS